MFTKWTTGMIEEIAGGSMIVAALAALAHAIRAALPRFADAAAAKEEADLIDARSDADAHAAIRRRLDACERIHRKRATADRKRAAKHAREIAALRAQVAALKKDIRDMKRRKTA